MAEPLSRLRAFLLLRYTLIAATAYLLLCEDRFAVPGVGVSLVVALALASNVVAAMLPARVVDSTPFAAGVIVGDTVWITAALLWSGHFSADFFYLYFFVLLLAAIGESLGLIAIGAVAVCAAYVYVLAVTGTGWSLWSSPSIIRVPFLFSAAAFYGYLVDRVRREERKVVAAQLSARARGEFLATVSHEIRTPMNGVIGWTELLLETPLTLEQREYALGVRRSGRSLLAIINDILDLSKIEAGKLRLEVADFDPRAVVEEVGDLFAEAAQRKRLELAYRVDADVPMTVRGDAGRLRQILTNLVGNAIKFTDAGEAVLRVRVAEPAPDGVVLRFEVTDTGIGIAREQRERLFQAFSQADSSTTRKYGGTGLGLAISQQLVAAMGGAIDVASRPGQGSTFWFTARFGGAAGAPPRPAAAITRVLVVDDSATARGFLADELRDAGVVCDVAPDAPAALARLRAAAAAGTPHDVALVDLDMPSTSGAELAEAIAADRALATVQVVLVVPVGRREQAEAALAAHVAAVLTKPVRPSRLHEALAALAEPPSAAAFSAGS